MSTAPTPSPYPHPAGLLPKPKLPSDPALNSISLASPDLQLRRRTTFEQGRALEILGHALEYLIDSRMYLIDVPHTPADSQATQILMRLSREIFHECTDVTTPAQRLRLWFADRLRTASN